MTTYIFNEAGSIPGIPGTFANCQVEVLESGALLVGPLEQHPSFIPSLTSVDANTPSTEQAPNIVQEQVSPDLALNIG